MTNELSAVQKAIIAECDGLKELLLEKNRAYGNSALDPIRVFSKATQREQILVRIDDKLSRLSRGTMNREDVVQDLLGYLILLRITDKEVKEEGITLVSCAACRRELTRSESWGVNTVGSSPLEYFICQPCWQQGNRTPSIGPAVPVTDSRCTV